MQAMSKMSARVVSQTSNKRFIIPLEFFFYVFKQLYFLARAQEAATFSSSYGECELHLRDKTKSQ